MKTWIPLLIALLGIVGALLGTTLGQHLAQAHERDRWLREDQTRWHQSRLDAYAALLNEFHTVMQAATPLAQANAMDSHYDPDRELTVEHLSVALDNAMDGLSEARFKIQLVASQPVIDAVENLWMAATKGMTLAHRGIPPPPSPDPEALKWQQISQIVSQARPAFFSAVRNELGISPESTNAPVAWAYKSPGSS